MSDSCAFKDCSEVTTCALGACVVKNPGFVQPKKFQPKSFAEAEGLKQGALAIPGQKNTRKPRARK